jgi:site-specific recombinase XerC
MGGRGNHHTIFGAKLFRQHLVAIGVCQSAAALQHLEPSLVADFKIWLRKHRGASDRTIKLYARDATDLMAALGNEPEGWEPAAIRSFFLDRASHCGSGTVEKLTTSLRAFLRYLAVKGRCRAGLADVVPGYAHWRLADAPRYLAPEQVIRLIAACDGEVGARRRDRAIVLLLARLGLRAGDVAQLRLNDIEWETGSLRVSGKSRYEVRLPLPQDVGDAIAAYLAYRPSTCPSDHVFLRNIAPFRPFRKGDGISSVVKRLIRSLHCRSQQPTDLTRRCRFWPFPLLDTRVTVAGGRFDMPNRITDRPFCEELHGHFRERLVNQSDSKDSAFQ